MSRRDPWIPEWLFHDNAQDMALYHDPKFRRQMARGIYHGIVDFWAAEIHGPPTYLPDPPRNLRARVTGSDEITVEWQPPAAGHRNVVGDPATGYRVYMSAHGRGFPPPESVTGTALSVGGLEPGRTYYVRVSAANAGGESFPTETLAARVPVEANDPRLLIVSGFDKLDVATRVQTAWGGGTLYRQFVYRMNGFDQIVEHARAIDAWDGPISFDSAEHDVIELPTPLIDLGDYDAVIWIGGLQAEVSTIDPVDDTALKSRTRTRLADYLAGGGRLFMSGAEIGWDLDRLGQTGFMTGTLKFSFVEDGSGLAAASGAAGSIFEGLAGVAFGGAGAPYAVHWPDVIEPASGAVAALHYGLPAGAVLVDEPEVRFDSTHVQTVTGGNAGDLYFDDAVYTASPGSPVAAVQYDGVCKVVHMGFPFETIEDEGTRNSLMARILEFFELDAPVSVDYLGTY